MGLVKIIDLHGWHVSEQHHQRSSLIFNGKLRIVELILYNHEKLWPVKYSSQSFYENESTYLSCAYFEETPENKKSYSAKESLNSFWKNRKRRMVLDAKGPCAFIKTSNFYPWNSKILLSIFCWDGFKVFEPLYRLPQCNCVAKICRTENCKFC